MNVTDNKCHFEKQKIIHMVGEELIRDSINNIRPYYNLYKCRRLTAKNMAKNVKVRLKGLTLL